MYSFLSSRYDQLFPLQKDLTEQWIKQWPASSILDVGCGTGLFIQALEQQGWKVYGREYTSEMAHIARSRGLRISSGGFIGLDSIDQGFDHVSCLGNTLPHASSYREIQHFFKEARRVLKPRGILHLQYIRFSHLRKNHPQGFQFPLLEVENLEFKREYHWRDDGFVDFNSQLYQDSQLKMEETVQLLELDDEKIISLAEDSGFQLLEQQEGTLACLFRFKSQ